MSITSRSLEKLLRDNISGEKPLRVDRARGLELASELVARVEHLAGVKRNDKCHSYPIQRGSSADKPKDELCCCLLLDEHSDRWYRNETPLRLLRSPDRQLWVQLAYERSAPVSDISEVVDLVQAFLQRVERQKAQAAKRQKQKDLKIQAILAQVRKIAKEDKFDFATEVDSFKLKLIIRLSDDDDFFVILIPFNRFKDVLPKLRTAIQALRETYNSGVRFTTRLKRGSSCSGWVRHKDL